MIQTQNAEPPARPPIPAAAPTVVRWLARGVSLHWELTHNLFRLVLYVFALIAVIAVICELKKPEPAYATSLLVLAVALGVFTFRKVRSWVGAYVVALWVWFPVFCIGAFLIFGPNYQLRSEAGHAVVKLVLFGVPVAMTWALLKLLRSLTPWWKSLK